MSYGPLKRNKGFPSWLTPLIGVCLIQWFSTHAVTHASPASDPRIKRDQIERIETDLSREKEQFLKFDEREKDLLEQLANLEKETVEKKRRLSELEEKINLSKGELANLQMRLKQTEGSLTDVEERVGRRLTAFYKYARRAYFRVLTTSKDLDELGRRIFYLKIILSGDLHLLRDMDAVKQKHKQGMLSVQEKLSNIEQMEKEEGNRLLSIKEDLDKKVVLLMKIHKEREFYETAVKELELASQNFRETLLSLEKDEGKQKYLPSNFAASRGKLSLPINGKIIAGIDSGKQSAPKGIYIEGAPGSGVKAIFPGRVDFSGQIKGYGQLVVINHGSRFFTVVAQLSSRNKQEGDMVNMGDVIGFMGREESNEIPRLYFEIRMGGVNLDPLEWLKLN